MNTLKVKLNHPQAKPPQKALPEDVAYDLYATEISEEKGSLVYSTGISIQPPEGYFAFLAPRSSQSNTNWVLANSVGIIDPNYRGDLQLRFKPIQSVSNYYAHKDVFLPPSAILNQPLTVSPPPFKIGDRIAQLFLLPIIPTEISITDDLSSTDRKGGFGSTGS